MIPQNRRTLVNQLKITLQMIRHGDPSNPAGQVPATTDAYRQRNALVYKALGLATAVSYRTGILPDPAQPEWVIAFIDLPDTGQVSWHLPIYTGVWDQHDTPTKYQRVTEFASVA